METKIILLSGETKTFPDYNSAIRYIKENGLLNYTAKSVNESFTFLGGKLFLADTPYLWKVGSIVLRKGKNHA